MPRGLTFGLLLFIARISMAQQPAATVPGENAATIQIVEGDGAINSIRLHRGHEPVVRVVTPGGEPVAGASVTFLLPASGASASFADSGLSITVVTDDGGIATGRGLRPNGVAGPFRIRVTTSWHGLPAVASLSQTNAEPVVHASHTKAIVILVVVAGAAAGGAAAALGHSTPASQSAANTGGTIAGSTGIGTVVAGSPTIGPPH